VPHHDEDVSRELLRGGAVPRHQDLSAGLRLLHQRGKDGSGPQGPECRQGERMMKSSVLPNPDSRFAEFRCRSVPMFNISFDQILEKFLVS